MKRRQFIKGIGAATVAALVSSSNNDMTLAGWDKVDDGWKHIAVTRESDIVTAYLDGEKVGDYYTVIDCKGEKLYQVYERIQDQIRMREVTA